MDIRAFEQGFYWCVLLTFSLSTDIVRRGISKKLQSKDSDLQQRYGSWWIKVHSLLWNEPQLLS